MMSYQSLQKHRQGRVRLSQRAETSTKLAQVPGLLYRGFPIRRRREARIVCRMKFGDIAIWKPVPRTCRPPSCQQNRRGRQRFWPMLFECVPIPLAQTEAHWDRRALSAVRKWFQFSPDKMYPASVNNQIEAGCRNE
jgi:hypothetical protein